MLDLILFVGDQTKFTVKKSGDPERVSVELSEPDESPYFHIVATPENFERLARVALAARNEQISESVDRNVSVVFPPIIEDLPMEENDG